MRTEVTLVWGSLRLAPIKLMPRSTPRFVLQSELSDHGRILPESWQGSYKIKLTRSNLVEILQEIFPVGRPIDSISYIAQLPQLALLSFAIQHYITGRVAT